ncbi:ABC transporter permease [Clostridium neonatale]|uniref:ABC transporter permease n=1 Tax=Clostridium neonatale TaxID=137838 RepID=UPI00291C298D|nr:Transport permease protein [Clostridium neonatale]CAI3669638.1 Transport permease protein [Clostridium neonatale]CAI3670372.1 Transport permease protein [Clostridium neonatale]CAI3686580.1 Transport permease protein [Clostridium neonatale]CAI3716492.1 Transport permease protein [Clostridium neonatale]
MQQLKKYASVFLKYMPLLRELVQRDLKVRYRHSILGMLWTLLNPLLTMIVLSIVFSSMFKMNIDNFPVYAMIGNIVFSCNSEATNQAMNSIIWNSSLIKKVYIPKYLFPMSNVLSCLINFLFSFIALIIVMIFTKSEFYSTIITVWIPLLYLITFSFGLGMILCSINVFFRDMQHLYGVFTMVWMYLSAIFYPIEFVPDALKKFIFYNPMYQYITFFRTIIIDGVFPNIQTNLLCAAYSVSALIIGILTFRRLQDKFILHI